MHTNTEENYLKALFQLANEQGEVSVNDLSRHLGLKMPTVNSMVKKLGEKELVHYESYKPLRLTGQGRKEAAIIIRKHRLTEMFLVEKMGFGWEEVHEIAEQIEHLHSPAFFEKMDQLLGHPTLDPHGSPIPDSKGQIKSLTSRRLSECRPEEKVKLVAVTHSADDFLKFLNGRELKLGVELKVLAVESFDGSMTIRYGRRAAEMLSHTVCEKLLVK